MTLPLSTRILQNYTHFAANIPSRPEETSAFTSQHESSSLLSINNLFNKFSLENMNDTDFLSKLMVDELFEIREDISSINELLNEKKQIQKNINEALKVKYNSSFTEDLSNQFINIKRLFQIHIQINAGEESKFNDIFFRYILPNTNVNRSNPNGETALMLAAAYGLSLILTSLLNYKSIQINKTDKFRRTALHRAVENGHTHIVELLLERRDIELGIKCINLEEFDGEGETPVDLAIANNSFDIVTMLVRHPNFKDMINIPNTKGQTILWQACENNNYELVKIVFEVEGIEVTSVSLDGTSPFSRAAFHVNKNIMLLFLEHPKTEINTKVGSKQTPILTWAEKEDLNIVQLLIQHPNFHTLELEEARQTSFFDIICNKIAPSENNKKQEILKRFFDWVVEKGYLKLIPSFFNKPHFKLKEDYYIKGVHPLIWASKNNLIEEALFLFDRFNEEIKDNIINETSLLQYAVDDLNVKIIKLLLLRKNVNKDKLKVSPALLMHLVQKIYKKEKENKEIENRLKFLKYFLEHPNTIARTHVSGGLHILNWSTQANATFITEFLLTFKNVEFDFVDQEEKTPLYWALLHGNKKIINMIINLLVENNMEIKNVTDEKGNSLLHRAVMLGDIEIIDLFLSFKNLDFNKENLQGFTPLKLAKHKIESNNFMAEKAQFKAIVDVLEPKVRALIAEEKLKNEKSKNRVINEIIGRVDVNEIYPVQQLNPPRQLNYQTGSGRSFFWRWNWYEYWRRLYFLHCL